MENKKKITMQRIERADNLKNMIPTKKLMVRSGKPVYK